MESKKKVVNKDLSFIEEVESRFEEDFQKYSHIECKQDIIREDDEESKEDMQSDRAHFE